MVYIFLADGFEEVEAICPLDILRRGGINALTVGVTGKTVKGAHGIEVTADITIDKADFCELEAVILPGGMPGTLNLEKSDRVQQFIDYANENKLLIGAICAAPSILGHKGLLKDKKAVCFPGFEKELVGATVLDAPAVNDENIITARGAGAAFEFGFQLLSYLTKDDKKAEKLLQSMLYKI